MSKSSSKITFQQHLNELTESGNSLLSATNILVGISQFHKTLKSLEENINTTNPRPSIKGESYYSQLMTSFGQNIDKTPTSTPEIFLKKIAIAIITNNDKLLTSLIQKNRGMVNEIDDHRLLINLAVELKSTHTFEILLDRGFDPRKNASQVVSPIALAARDQGDNFLESYRNKIAEKFGAELVTTLINEKDANGDNALSYALQGKSYLSTFEFLRANGLDVSENLERNTKLAIQNRHSETLDKLLKENKTLLSNDLFLSLSNFAAQCDNLIVQRVLAENCSDGQTRKHMDEVIDSKHLDEDIFEICKKGSLQDFLLLSQIHSNQTYSFPNIQKTINVHDKNGKTPLFYALSQNCYNNLVIELLDKGALITDLTDTSKLQLSKHKKANGEGIDALTLCIRTKQPKTLGTILQHNAMNYSYDDGQLLLTHESLSNIVEEMISQQRLNAMVVKSFVENISVDRLQNLRSETFNSLKKTVADLVPEMSSKLSKIVSKNKTISNTDSEETSLLSSASSTSYGATRPSEITPEVENAPSTSFFGKCCEGLITRISSMVFSRR